MKYFLINSILLVFIITSPAYSESNYRAGNEDYQDHSLEGHMKDHQNKMITQIYWIEENMSDVKLMGATKVSLRKHLNSMQDGAHMISDMQNFIVKTNIECLEEEEYEPTDTSTCYTEESARDTQLRLLAVIINQMLKRMELKEM